jgi:hypothetical protein
VARPRLLATLDAAVSGQLVLVCAPAGYGKTLLLAEWAADNPATTAWVALDEDDNDDRRFWSAVLTGLAACAAFADVPDLGRLAVPARPSYDHEFVATVLAAIETAPSAVRLMLDDVHELTAPEPLHGLRALVRNQPPGLQVVLAGRSDPPLPLGRMRLGGRLCEIRAADLRFSLAEADAMFAAARIPVRADQLRRLVAQTEGWAAGLRLAALSMRGIADPDGFLADFVANSRAVSDYLVSEILERLPAADRELLGAVSVCDRLSAPLAAALSGRPDAGEVLDALEHETSLVISVGDGRVWYGCTRCCARTCSPTCGAAGPTWSPSCTVGRRAGSPTGTSPFPRSRTRGSPTTPPCWSRCCGGTPWRWSGTVSSGSSGKHWPGWPTAVRTTTCGWRCWAYWSTWRPGAGRPRGGAWSGPTTGGPRIRRPRWSRCATGSGPAWRCPTATSTPCSPPPKGTGPPTWPIPRSRS